MTTPLPCSVCGGRPETLFEKDGWPVGQCTTCGFVYVTRRPTREELDALYGESFFTPGGTGYDDYMNEPWRVDLARQRVRDITRLQPKGRMLELGAASGLLLAEARDHGFDVMGVEISDYASRYARDHYGLDVRTGDVADFDLADASFDVVASYDTIEHVADPDRNVAETARLLRPGGLAVISTGDIKRVRDLASWRLMYPPRHLSYFSRDTLTRLLTRYGMDVVQVQTTGQPTSPEWLPGRVRRLAATRLGFGDEMVVYARR